jgi:DNA invertase Pin-like site-specific DNA recombinase
MRKAYSYARFSTPGQKDGRSLERQLEAARAYCGRHGLTLQERTFSDLGLSARHGSNATHGELADFLGLVKEGRIGKGSVLLVENLDRVTRMPPDEATDLVMKIVKAGVDIHTISPEQQFTKSNIHEPSVWIPLQVAFCLSAEESRKKGERCADAWAAKRAALAAGLHASKGKNGEAVGRGEKGEAKTKLSERCPSWLALAADRKSFVVIEAKARMVRDIFAWALDGLGVVRITERLQEKYPGGLKGRGWNPCYVRDLLRCKSVTGTFQPKVGTCARRGRKRTSRDDGPAVKGYYPEIVSEDAYFRVQEMMNGRRRAEGGSGGQDRAASNLFRGLARDAHDGHRVVLRTHRGRRLLASAGALKKLPGCVYRAIPYQELEDAILSLLAELKAADVVTPNGAQAALEAASGRLTSVNHRLAQLQAKAKDAEDPSVYFEMIDGLARDRKAAVAALEEARAKAANEAGDTLGECLSLVALLRDAGDDGREDLRRKVRASLARLVARIDLLPVRRGKLVLLVAAQVRFRQGDKRRDYLVHTGRRGDWSAASLPPAVTAGLELDLRRRDHARDLAQALEAADIESLTTSE